MNEAPSNIPNKHQRDLLGRLVPKQKVHGNPVTFGSTMAKNRNVKSTIVTVKPKKIQPLSPKKEETPKEKIEIKDRLNTKDPFEYIKLARRGLDARDYVYLKPSNIIEDSEHPTNLVIINPKQAQDNEFWTLSLKGLTHYNEKVVDFIPLDNWIRYNELFSKIMRIPFFKYQRQWRHFKMWRKCIQSQKQQKAQISLSSNLFFAHPILRPAFIRIQKELNQLLQVRLFEIRPEKTYTVDSFLEENNLHRNNIASTFEQVFQNIIQILQVACEKTMDTLGRPEMEQEEEVDASPLDLLITTWERAQKHDAKSMYEAPPSQKFTDKATNKAYCQMLVRFIRVVDFNIINTLRLIVDHSMLDLYAVLITLHQRGVDEINYEEASYEDIRTQLPDEYKCVFEQKLAKAADTFDSPIFIAEAHYESGLQWNPRAADLLSAIEKVRSDVMTTILKTPRLILNPAFRQYLEKELEKGPFGGRRISTPDLGHIIYSDPVYKVAVSKTSEVVNRMQSLLDSYTTQFEQAINIYKANLSFDVSFMESDTITIADVRDAIKKLTSDGEFLKEITESADVGVFTCTIKGLKKSFIDSPNKCLKEITAQLPRVSKRFLEKFGDTVKKAHSELSITIDSSASFVQFISAVEKHAGDVHDLYRYSDLIRDFQQLASDRGIEPSNQEQLEFQELLPVFDQVKRYITFAEDQKSNLLPKYSNQLEKSISQLHSDAIDIVVLANNEKLSSLETQNDEAMSILEVVAKKTNTIIKLSEEYNQQQKVMGLTETDFDDVKQLSQNVSLKKLLWETRAEWEKKTEEWCNMAFVSIDQEKMFEEINEFVMKAKKVAEGLPENEVANDLNERVTHFAAMVPIISDLKNPSLKQNHTEQIERLLGDSFFGDPEFHFGKLVELKAYLYAEKIREISVQATNEQVLLDMLMSVKSQIESINFTVVPTKTHKNIYLLEGIPQIIASIDDSRSILSAVRASKYVAQHRSRCEEWVKLLTQFNYIVESIDKCQKRWAFYSEMFTNTDITRVLTASHKELLVVEKAWRSVSQRANDDPAAFKLCTTGNVMTELDAANASLDKIGREIDGFLNSKRDAFPRLYLLSDAEFIDLLSRPKDPQAIIPYLSKLFTGISTVELSVENQIPSIVCVISSSGERLQVRAVKFRNNIEGWLQSLLETVQKTVKQDIKSSQQKSGDMVREDWVQISTTQSVLVVSGLEWCSMIEGAIQSGNPSNSLTAVIDEIDKRTGTLMRFTHLDLHPVERNKIESILSSDLHYRDIVSKLIQEKVSSVTDPLWEKQILYKWDENTKELIVALNNESFEYGYEYMGSAIRHILTPASEMELKSILGNHKRGFGSAFIGVHNTGKTQSILALAGILGIFVAVRNIFNNSTQFQLGNLVSGAAQGGFWLVLENLSNVPTTELSSFSELIQSIQTARLERAKKYEVDGFDIPLSVNCSIFITEQSVQKYGEIPGTIKECFRPISMQSVDLQSIAATMLFSLGFQNPIAISDSVSQVFISCQSLVSDSSKFFFSARSLVTVLNDANRIKYLGENNEEIAVARAINGTIVGNMGQSDGNIVRAVIKNELQVDLPDEIGIDIIEQYLDEACAKCQLTPTEYIKQKTIQLRTAFSRNRAVILVGEPSSGKTSALRILEEALTLQASQSESFKSIQKFSMYPGMFTPNEFMGFVDGNGQWHNGALDVFLNSCPKSDQDMWIGFDGPFRTNWVDIIASAFDNRQAITYANGKEYSIPFNRKIYIETTDISQATPSLISRCAVISFSSKELGWEAYEKIATENRIVPMFTQNDTLLKTIKEIQQICLGPIVEYIMENEPGHCPISLIDSYYTIFAALVNGKEFGTNDTTIIAEIYCFSLMWGFGGFMTNSHRILFDTFVRDLMGSLPGFPPRGVIYDYYIDIDTATWHPWSEKVPRFGINSNDQFTVTVDELRNERFFVPTTETVRISYILTTLLRSRRNVFLKGAHGSGLTTLVDSVVNTLEETDGFAHYVVPFSASTDIKTARSLLSRAVERVQGKVIQTLGRRYGVLIFDGFGEQKYDEPTELVRGLLSGSGVCLNDEYTLSPTKNMNILSVTSKDVDKRLLRHAFNIEFTPPDVQTIATIISSVYNVFFSKYDASIRNATSKVALAQAVLSDSVISTFKPTLEKPQYTFSLHTIASILRGVMYATPHCIQTEDSFIRLVFGEFYRACSDRMIHAAEKRRFDDLVSSSLKNKACVEMSVDQISSSIFTDMDIWTGENAILTYQEYNINTIIDPLSHIIDEYIKAKKITGEYILPMEAMGEHVARLLKVIKHRDGHAILYGKIGSTKRTVTQLASFAAGCEVVTIDSQVDIRQNLVKVGTTGKRVVLIIKDTLLSVPEILNNVSMISNRRDVTALLMPDELEKSCNELIFYAKTNGENESMSNLQRILRDRIEKYLHIIIISDSDNPNFFTKAPELLNTFHLDYFERMPDESLGRIATAEYDGQEDAQKLIDASVFLHQTAADSAENIHAREGKKLFITPTLFQYFISTFQKLYESRKAEHEERKAKLVKAIEKLDYTTKFIELTEQSLKELEPRLDSKTLETEQLTHYIGENEITFEKFRQRLKYEEKKVGEKSIEVKDLEQEVQDELDSVLPQLQTSIAQLKGLNRGDIMDLRSFGDPPVVIKTVMEVICILAEADLGWKSAVQLLTDTAFITKISSKFSDGNHVPESIMKKVRPYVESNPNFQESEVGRISIAAKSLCVWATALYNYEVAFENVKPKEEEIENKKNVLEKMKKAFAKKSEEAQNINNQIQDLKKKYEAADSERKQLAETIAISKNRIAHAKKLVLLLTNEDSSWRRKLKSVEEEEQNIKGDSFLCAAYLVYFGAMPASYRDHSFRKVMKKLTELELHVTSGFSFIRAITDSATVQKWVRAGLPNDITCIENAAIIMNSPCVPFIIDPTGTCNKFLQVLEEDRQILVLRNNAPNMNRSIETQIRLGVPVLIEDNNGKIDRSLELLMMRKVYIQDGKHYVKIGERSAECEERYTIYFTSPLSNPDINEQLFTKSTIVDFEVSLEALAENELQFVLEQAEPQLAEQISTLGDQLLQLRSSLSSSESKVIDIIRLSTDLELLENDMILVNLENSKNQLLELGKSLRSNEIALKEAELKRTKYLPLSRRIALIYVVAQTQWKQDPSYVYSSDLFRSSVSRIMAAAKNSLQPDIVKYMTRELYRVIARSMTASHQQVFAFSIAVELMIEGKKISRDDVRIMHRRLPRIPPEKKNPLKFLSEDKWSNICALAIAEPPFRKVPDLICSNNVAVDSWLQVKTEEVCSAISVGLSDFQKLILAREMCDETLSAMTVRFIEKALGHEFTLTVPFDLAQTMQDSTPTTPILITLHGDVDPPRRLIQASAGMTKVRIRSLGSAGMRGIEKAMNFSMSRGEWLVFENCEYADPMVLAEIYSRLTQATDPGFRLFLSCSDASNIMPRIVKLSVKAAIEHPRSLKLQLLRLASLLPDEYFMCIRACQVTFALMIVHVILNARSFFGPLSFAPGTSWSDSDFIFSSNLARTYLNDEKSVAPLADMVSDSYTGKCANRTDYMTTRSIIEQIISDDSLQGGNAVMECGTVTIPEAETRQAFVQYISTLHDDVPPKLLGLHQSSLALYQTPKPALSAASQVMNDFETATFIKSLKKLVPEAEEFVESNESAVLADPTLIVIERDGTKLLNSVRVMQRTLEEADCVASGSREPLESANATLRSISRGVTPMSWQQALPGPLPVIEWVRRLSSAVVFFNKLALKAKVAVYDISSFVEPGAFLAAVVQRHVRSNPGSHYVLVAEPLQHVPDTPAQKGVYICGLMLAGCRYDPVLKTIVQCEKAPMSRAPILHLKPEVDIPEDAFMCPIYEERMESRSVITWLPIRSARSASFWLLRGASLHLSQ